MSRFGLLGRDRARQVGQCIDRCAPNGQQRTTCVRQRAVLARDKVHCAHDLTATVRCVVQCLGHCSLILFMDTVKK